MTLRQKSFRYQVGVNPLHPVVEFCHSLGVLGEVARGTASNHIVKRIAKAAVNAIQSVVKIVILRLTAYIVPLNTLRRTATVVARSRREGSEIIPSNTKLNSTSGGMINVLSVQKTKSRIFSNFHTTEFRRFFSLKTSAALRLPLGHNLLTTIALELKEPLSSHARGHDKGVSENFFDKGKSSVSIPRSSFDWFHGNVSTGYHTTELCHILP